MKSLIPLQSCDEKFSKTQIMRHKLRRKINEGTVKLQAAKSGVKQVVRGRGMPLTNPFLIHQSYKPKHEPQPTEVVKTSEPTVLDALADLRSLICPPRRQIKKISSYVTCHKVEEWGWIECKEIDFRFPTQEELNTDLFSKVNSY